MTEKINAPITLDKGGCAWVPKKSQIKAVLRWHGRDNQKAGDLDFYCFYVTKKNECGKIYYNNMGGKDVSPYIHLLGDSKEPGEEIIIIERPEKLKYILFSAYSAAENGLGSFYSYNAMVIISNADGYKVIAPLLEKNEKSYWVAMASLDFIAKRGAVEVKQVERYSKENSERSPILKPDGTIEMDAGDIEFKGLDLNVKK